MSNSIYFSILLLLLIPYALALAIVLVESRKYNVTELMVKTSVLPSVTVVLPTYNESAIVRKKIENILNLDYPDEKLEVLIVDSSTDDTPKIVEAISKEHPNVKMIREGERRGLAIALNTAYASAQGEIVVKSDTDSTTMTRDAIRRVVSLLKNPKIGGACGVRTGFRDTEAGLRSLEAIQQMAESQIDSTIIAHGSFCAFRKELIEPIDPTSFADDTEMFLKIRRKGYRTVVDNGIITFEPYEKRFVPRMKQMSRRAGGIVRVLVGNADILLGKTDASFSYVVYPINLLSIVIFPWWALTMFTLAFLTTFSIIGSIALPIFVVISLLLCCSYAIMKPWGLAGLLDIAASIFLGELKLLLGKHDYMWEKVRVK